jgi:Flp pilus assembly protein protease CpaA
MNLSTWIRRFHRWVAIVFTLTVAANFAAMTQGTPPAWITYSPLLPLALLLISGLYLFVLPYLGGGERVTTRSATPRS